MGGLTKPTNTLERRLLPETAFPSSTSASSGSYATYYVLQVITLAYLTYETVSAGYRFRNNIPMVTFIVGMYLGNILLLWVGRQLDTMPAVEEVRRRKLMKVGCVVFLTIVVNLWYPLVVTLLPVPLRVVFLVVGGGLVVCSLFMFLTYCQLSDGEEKAEGHVMKRSAVC